MVPLVVHTWCRRLVCGATKYPAAPPPLWEGRWCRWSSTHGADDWYLMATAHMHHPELCGTAPPMGGQMVPPVIYTWCKRRAQYPAAPSTPPLGGADGFASHLHMV